MARPTKRRQAVPPELSAQVIATYGNDCWLQLPGCTGKGTTSDHIVPWITGGATTLPNLRRACTHCNSRRSDRVLSGYGATVHVVMGPPAAGKSAYVDATASPDAIVLDMSRLLPALAPQVATVHMNSAALSTALSAAWAGTYNRLVRLPQPVDVWIVASLPTPAQIADWVALDYDMHVMEQSSITTAEKLSNSDEMNQARARQWYTLGLTQAHVDALKARRHTQLRSVGLMASIADESKSSW